MRRLTRFCTALCLCIGVLVFPKCISADLKCTSEKLKNLMISISGDNGGIEIKEKWNTYTSIQCKED
jgi:hypothetical protein